MRDATKLNRADYEHRQVCTCCRVHGSKDESQKFHDRAQERCVKDGHCWDQNGRDCPVVEGVRCTECYWCGTERWP